MSGAVFSYALLAALATALLVAAFTDCRRREIDNGLNAAIALAAPLWWLSMGLGWIEIGMQLVLCAITFALACVLFALRQMGGGDVKLLTVLALWFPAGSFMQLVMLMAVIGGGGSIVMAAFNMKRIPGEALRDGLALVAALAWFLGACAVIYSMTMQRPLIDPETTAAIAASMPASMSAVLIVALVVVTALLLLTLGFLHIVRRQRSRLPIPYGIAIAAAGLWVLGAQTLSAARMAAQSG